MLAPACLCWKTLALAGCQMHISSAPIVPAMRIVGVVLHIHFFQMKGSLKWFLWNKTIQNVREVLMNKNYIPLCCSELLKTSALTKF